MINTEEGAHDEHKFLWPILWKDGTENTETESLPKGVLSSLKESLASPERVG